MNGPDEVSSHIAPLADPATEVGSFSEAIRRALESSHNLRDITEPACYWDASTMAPLNAVSKAAIARLRAYKPPSFSLWDRLPVNKRAAVLVLLYPDRSGDLRVVITLRAMSLRNFSGHAAFPGGKADTTEETPYQIARREAWEEIGLPMSDSQIPKPFRIEELCSLPHNLARTELVVRPVVALLHADATSGEGSGPLVEESMIPRLDAKEVAAVFSAPFQNFLSSTDPELPEGQNLPEGHWYDGSWIHWKDEPWRVHNFYVPVNNQIVTTPENQDGLGDKVGGKTKQEKQISGRFKVWGMTARILVDAAVIAYGKQPEFENNTNFGDEKIITTAEREGSFGDSKVTKM